MADVSKIKGTDNAVYNVKDATARAVTDTFNVITLTGSSGTLTTAQYNSLNKHTIIEWKASSDDSTILYCINPKEAQLSYLYRGFSSDDAVITITILKPTRDWTKTTTTLSTSGHSHTASNIISGTFAAARIPNLDASKITTGTIAPERLDIAQNLNLWSIGNGYVYNTEYGGNWYNFGDSNGGFQSVDANTTYTISFNVTKKQFIKYYDSSKNYLSGTEQYTSDSKTFTTPNNCAYILVVCVATSTGVNIMLNKGSSALAYMSYIPPYKVNDHWDGNQFNLLSGTGKTSELSFYGIIDKFSATHTIRIVGTLVLRRNDGDLGSYYGGFPITNITQNVGVSSADKLIKTTDLVIGTCTFGTNDTLNGYGGRAYFVGINDYVHLGRLYDISNGAIGGWAWDTIGDQVVSIDWTIEYTD